jgi:hypothetical protein
LLGRLEGSATARARLEIILQTLTGRLPLAQACRQLGVSERRVYELRQEALQAALRSLEPRPPGRPATQPREEDSRLTALQAEVQRLQLELRAAQVREEIALAMPQLLHRRGQTKKAAARKGRRPAPRSAGPDG